MNVACKLTFDIRIAGLVEAAEKEFARQLGYDAMGQAYSSWRAFDDALYISGCPDKPAVWPRGAGPR